jgi:nucleotide-binding universal stress UspA family protein
MLNIKTILFATDFTERAEYAFQLACALARDYGARLLITHAHIPAPIPYGDFGALPEPIELQQSLKGKLERIRPTDPGIVYEHVFLIGGPAPEIVRLASERHVDLIVMGTHGRRGLGRVLMGSVAEQVVRKANCPVVTVKLPFAETMLEEDAKANVETECDLTLPRYPT